MRDRLAFLRGSLLPEGEDEDLSRLSLERTQTAWLDRRLPAHPIAYLAVSFAIPVAVWIVALVVARDRARFLGDPHWQAQPLFFAVHLVVLRLFVTAYTRYFHEGIAFLVPEAQAARGQVRTILGPLGFTISLVLAAPLIFLELRFLYGQEYLSSPFAQGEPGAPHATDHLLAFLWAIEWIVTTYVWVLLVGFAQLTIRTLERYPFQATLETLLHERHYRPFLLMSAKGASILFVFTAAYAGYVWFTKGDTTVYIGLWVTAGLLLVSFVPPWVRLKARVARRMREESHRLRVAVIDARARAHLTDDGKSTYTLDEVGSRLDVAVTMLQLDHLERLYRDLGKSEGQQILLRMLAPASTIVFRLLRGG